jgi:hypothetical protein
MHTKFLSENLKERDHSEDLSIDGRILIEGLESADWMHLAHDRDQWRVLVNTVMNLGWRIS